MLHSKTQKRELVDKLFELGLSVSYDRVLNISTELGNKVCHHYETKGVVCPPELKCGLFTTAAIDNIDHDPKQAHMTYFTGLAYHSSSTQLIRLLD